MATKKKTPAPRKTARKTTASGKTKARSKATPRKSAAKPASARTLGPREQELASNALKLVDQAAVVLRKGIRASADTTEKARLEAKKRAHDLLSKATSALHRIISRI